MQSCGSKGLKRSTSPARKVMYTLYLLHDDIMSMDVISMDVRMDVMSMDVMSMFVRMEQDILLMGAVPCRERL